MPAEPLFRSDSYLKTATAKVTYAGPDGIRLDRTLFYPTGGGQPGDTGVLRWNGGEVRITDSRKYRAENEPEDILHIVDPATALPTSGTDVETVIDWDRRYAHMRMHTTLHLLSAMFREFAITGGQVGADKSRIDMDITSDQLPTKEDITAHLNQMIAGNHNVVERWITDEELTAQPELVRTMSVKPPMGFGRVRLLAIGDSVDLQPCGGTHVKNTSEIGAVDVIKIENKGKQNRRIVVAFRTAT